MRGEKSFNIEYATDTDRTAKKKEGRKQR